MQLRTVLCEILVFGWSMAVLARVGMIQVGGVGSGVNRRELSALDVLGHSSIVAARARNIDVPRVRQVLTAAGALGEVVQALSSVQSPEDLRLSMLTDAPAEAAKWAGSLERDPALKKLVAKPQVDIALPLCAAVVYLGALFSRVLPREASLAVAMAASAMVILAQQADPTAKGAFFLNPLRS